MKDNDRYTDVEICTLYRRGSSITILNQLTGKSNYEIKNILMNGGYIEMNNERKEIILEKYKEGLSDVAIARVTGYPQSQISPFLRSQGLPPNGKIFSGKAKKQEDLKVDTIQVKQETEKAKEEIVALAKKIEEDILEEPMEEVMENLEKEFETVQVDSINLEKLKNETKKNYEDLKAALPVLPQSMPDQNDVLIDYDVVETEISDADYVKLATMTLETINGQLEILKRIWG